MKSMIKIHFINRIDKDNAGDWSCCPLLYYYDYFKHYSLIRHDIDFVNYNEINQSDIVILGGGGMLNVTVSFNTAINRILDICDTVVLWSGGFNTHDEQWFQGDKFPEIDFNRFSLISIRDFNHPSGIEYLPCPSVLAFPNPDMDKTNTKKKYGIIEHKDLPIKVPLFEDKITNNASMETIYKFILSHEAILTNSYHCAYWTLILGRKAIVVNKFSTKFDYFKYKPEFININENDNTTEITNKITEAFTNALVYKSFYDEAARQNNHFFEKVKSLVESKDIPKDKDYQNLYQLNIEQLWNMQAEPEKIKLKIYELHEDVYGQFRKIDYEMKNSYHQLHDKLYGEMNQSCEELSEKSNQIYREIYKKIDQFYDELYEQQKNLHDELYTKLHDVSADLFKKTDVMDGYLKQLRLEFEEEKNKSLFRRFRAMIIKLKLHFLKENL